MYISFWQLYRELRHQEKLKDKRHPMFEKNKFAKFMAYFMIAYYAALLLFMGVTMPSILDGSMAHFHVLDSGFFYLLIVSFWCRFIFQMTPAKEMKPYTLLNIERRKVLDYYLIQAGLSWGNLFILICFLLPFACMSVWHFYGFWGTVGWLFGYWLLFVVDAYWYLLCRSLIIKHIAWLILPIVVDAAIILATVIPDSNPLGYLFVDWIEQFIFWNPLAYLAPVVLIGILYAVNRKVQYAMTYNEVAKVEETEMKHTSEFKALNRFGVLGEYLKLEIRMRTRNKVVSTQSITGFVLILFFSIALSFSDVYDNGFMTSFICLYNYIVLGIMTLSSIMSFEGNYIDGLMSRHESIYDLLRAKYFFNLALLLLPLLLMIPTIVTGKTTLLMNLGYICFVGGVIFPILFQYAAYNSDTLPLNTKMTAKTNNWVQQVVSLVAMFLPIPIEKLIVLLCGDVWGYVVLIIIGLAGIMTCNLWIRNVYQRFMLRRYKNMEGFRASRITV